MSEDIETKQAAKASSFGHMHLKGETNIVYGVSRNISAMELLELKQEAQDLSDNINFFSE